MNALAQFVLNWGNCSQNLCGCRRAAPPKPKRRQRASALGEFFEQASTTLEH
jgi:hypothetical protein